MTSPFGPMRLIANPTAGRGRDPVLPRLTAALDDRGLEHDVATTGHRGHAAGLARQAVEDGIRYVVAVGGDGTVHEVVNGLIDAEDGPLDDEVVFATVPAGSGTDFVRTFGLRLSPERMARHLEGDAVQPIDIGRVRLSDRSGAPKRAVFANIADVGYAAVVVDRAERLPRFLGQVRYLAAVFAAIRSFELREVRVVLDHTEQLGSYSNIVVANGQFFGGAMKVAPRALPDDGLFHVQLWRGSVADVFRKTPRIRRGDHTRDPDVQEYRSSTVEVHTSEPILVEADGEVIGTTDATFDLLPRALRLKI